MTEDGDIPVSPLRLGEMAEADVRSESQIGSYGPKRRPDELSASALVHSLTTRNLKAFVMTLTDDSAIAAAAMGGESIQPKVG